MTGDDRTAGDDNRELDAVQGRLGHRFADPDLLIRALTHSSVDVAPGNNNERLEFLGDRVLGLAVANLLIEAFPEAPEGDLAARLNRLVSGKTCALVAESLRLGEALIMAESEAQSGGRRRRSALADACEAVIAAIYLDAGYEDAAAFISRHWKDRMLDFSGPIRDAKTTLQEWTQSQNQGVPDYEVIERTGPDHDPRFVVRVEAPPLEPGTGAGRSKRDAEQDAASKVLVREGIWQDTSNG